jgi:hypothetical protein
VESEIAFDKIRSKERRFAKHGLTTPYWQIMTRGQRPTIPIPFVIKRRGRARPSASHH